MKISHYRKDPLGGATVRLDDGARIYNIYLPEDPSDKDSRLMKAAREMVADMKPMSLKDIDTQNKKVAEQTEKKIAELEKQKTADKKNRIKAITKSLESGDFSSVAELLA